jgi:hypothetical protein
MRCPLVKKKQPQQIDRITSALFNFNDFKCKLLSHMMLMNRWIRFDSNKTRDGSLNKSRKNRITAMCAFTSHPTTKSNKLYTREKLEKKGERSSILCLLLLFSIQYRTDIHTCMHERYYKCIHMCRYLLSRMQILPVPFNAN